MTVDIGRELARAQASAARHRRADKVLITLAVLACVTVLVTWLLGRFLLRGMFGRTDEYVLFDNSARSTGTYFLTDWTAGCALVLALLGLLLILRPWGLRVGFGVVGVLSLGAAVALGVVSLNEWRDAEATTAGVSASSASPWDVADDG